MYITSSGKKSLTSFQMQDHPLPECGNSVVDGQRLPVMDEVQFVHRLFDHDYRRALLYARHDHSYGRKREWIEAEKDEWKARNRLFKVKHFLFTILTHIKTHCFNYKSTILGPLIAVSLEQ